MLRIGISGKRNILPGEKAGVAKGIEEAIRNILSKHHAVEFIGMTALATGADTIFAEVVTTVFKSPLHIVLPFAHEEYRKDFTSREEALQLDFFLENNEDITTLMAALPADENERNEAYLNAGKYIVDNSKEVVFVWDGRKPDGKGGTAEIISYYSQAKHMFPVDYICVTPTYAHPLRT